MFGIGGAEFLVIVVIALLVLGAPAVIGYFVGYRVGASKAADSAERRITDSTPSEEDPIDE